MPVCEHLVQFYESDRELLESVAPYLADGLDAGDAVLVVATERHRVAFEARLRTRGIDLEAATAARRYLAVDATEVLAYIRPQGELQSDAFDDVIGGLVRRHAGAGTPVRAYGEMVALLWEAGDTEGAATLERMWNELLDHEPLTLMCGYPRPPTAEQLEAVRRVCRSHSAVIPSITDGDLDPAAAPVTAEFEPSLDAPRRVRAVLRSALGELGLSEDLIQRGALTASELAANAVLHARTPFRLLIKPQQASVWIAVEDRAPLLDRRKVVGRSPHGLGLVAALALRWGITPRRASKVVWAELPY